MKIIKLGQEARDGIKKGIDLVADCVKVTLGPAGRNAVLGKLDIPPTVTNDGVSIALNVESEDEIEQLGVMMVKEAASLASKKAGDGTTTTTVLLQAIVNDLFEQIKDDGSLVSKKPNVIQLKRAVDEACDLIVKELQKRARPIKSNEIYNVALGAGEYSWIAKIVADVYENIGKDGYVDIQEGKETSYKVSTGLELKAGFHSDYYINNDNDECVIENPYVLVTNNLLEINTVANIIEGMKDEEVKKNLTGIILVAPDFSRDLLARLAKTMLDTKFPIVALKLPYLGKDDHFLDIAIFTKAKFIDKNVLTNVDSFIGEVGFKNMARIERAVIGPSKTMLIGGKGDTKKRVADLKKQYKASQSIYDKDALEKRIASLSGGSAVITVGAESEFERSYFKLKMENAVNAAQNAMRDGVVKGGGMTLKEISEKLPQNVLSQAIQAPYKQLKENAGGILKVGESVIDPLETAISSLKTACSIAGTVLTTEVAIAFKKEKPREPQD